MSVTGAFTTTGVSTSSTPRSMKKLRADASRAARCCSMGRVEVGRQSTIRGHHTATKPGKWLANANAVGGLHAGQPVDHVGCGYQDHGRAHVEAAHLVAFLEAQGGARRVQRQFQRLA